MTGLARDPVGRCPAVDARRQTLTFAEQTDFSLALLVLAAWFVIVGYLGRSSGVLPGGVRMGLLAATYVGYPIWALWLGRRLLRLAGEPASGPGDLV